MTVVKWAFIGLLLLPTAEFVVFVAVAAVIGWIWAALLFVATSVIGVLLLRRSGRRDLDRFRSAVKTDGIASIRVDGPGVGPLIGGILLVFPGFITDILGALMLLGPIRRWAAAAIGRAFAKPASRPRRQGEPSVIDLSPDEWRQVSDRALDGKQRRPRRRHTGT
jgi:UPF0716 protein FxsA